MSSKRSAKRNRPSPKVNQAASPKKPRRVFDPGELLRPLALFGSFLLVEVFAALLLKPDTLLGLAFAACWAALLTAAVYCLPRLAGRIVYGIAYYVITAWTIAQTGYYQLFGKIMWLSDMRYADEGAGYADVLLDFSPLWWIGTVCLIALGVFCIRLIPKRDCRQRPWIFAALSAALSVAGLCLLPQAIYARDIGVWGTRSEYGQSSSARASYTVMYDNRSVYDLCGIYQLTVRDLWKHEIYPLTPAYRRDLKKSIRQIDEYFAQRDEGTDPQTAGIFRGKNVILVLMESMDDWMITRDDTPTICRLMDEGINFTNFYTPGFGSVRTFNTEFCANTGIYLPTTGTYVFDYVTNSFDQSLANRLNARNYSSLTFHYNTDEFYSRGAFEPAMGYEDYVSYGDYTDEKNDLYSDQYLFDNPQIADLFFRDGQTFNFIITNSAHLSYKYNEVLSHYALKLYPAYKGAYGHEEIDCARVKARLVDDMFARLLRELELRGQLENTVIVGITDHYTYGFDDTDTLMELSGTDDTLLLEKTPCFIWAADCPDLEVTKTLNTADLLPTVMHLLGSADDTNYLGRCAFDPQYTGCAFFPDGSWISDGVACKIDEDGAFSIIMNEKGKTIEESYLHEMYAQGQTFIHISNLLLTSNYYHRSK